MSSPRTWRCFHSAYGLYQSGYVFSTHVEVFPCYFIRGISRCSLLHARGGVSIPCFLRPRYHVSSPRTWRCFLFHGGGDVRMPVFSTYVEVFLLMNMLRQMEEGLLHVRGGVSHPSALPVLLALSSPRTWRCFLKIQIAFDAAIVFSTYVEVFLHSESFFPCFCGLLHVRGGVSPTRPDRTRLLRSSPRTWRCFSRLVAA